MFITAQTFFKHLHVITFVLEITIHTDFKYLSQTDKNRYIYLRCN